MQHYFGTLTRHVIWQVRCAQCYDTRASCQAEREDQARAYLERQGWRQTEDRSWICPHCAPPDDDEKDAA
jgi:hypothetical protein